MTSSLRRMWIGLAGLLLGIAGPGFVSSTVHAGCGDTSVDCLAGRIDNFATGDGPELAVPSALLLAAMANPASGCEGVVTTFDTDYVDECFGHTLTGCWPTDCAAGATLTFHARAGSDDPDTDDLLLGDNANPIYSIPMKTLQSLRTGGADMTWDTGDEGVFVLDLASLPAGSGGGPDIRASLQDGQLDFVVSDETIIDYLQLHVRVNATPVQNLTWGQVKSTYR